MEYFETFLSNFLSVVFGFLFKINPPAPLYWLSFFVMGLIAFGFLRDWLHDFWIWLKHKFKKGAK